MTGTSSTAGDYLTLRATEDLHCTSLLLIFSLSNITPPFVACTRDYPTLNDGNSQQAWEHQRVTNNCADWTSNGTRLEEMGGKAPGINPSSPPRPYQGQRVSHLKD